MAEQQIELGRDMGGGAPYTVNAGARLSDISKQASRLLDKLAQTAELIDSRMASHLKFAESYGRQVTVGPLSSLFGSTATGTAVGAGTGMLRGDPATGAAAGFFSGLANGVANFFNSGRRKENDTRLANLFFDPVNGVKALVSKWFEDAVKEIQGSSLSAQQKKTDIAQLTKEAERLHTTSWKKVSEAFTHVNSLDQDRYFMAESAQLKARLRVLPAQLAPISPPPKKATEMGISSVRVYTTPQGPLSLEGFEFDPSARERFKFA